jgi:hypothetical protein
MAMVSEKAPVAPTVPQRPPVRSRPLNAQDVTIGAVAFLGTLGYKKGVNPKRVFVENNRYVVEADIGSKLLASVQIDIATKEIKEYSIEEKPEEERIGMPIDLKAILLILGESAAVYVLLTLIDLPSLLQGLF